MPINPIGAASGPLSALRNANREADASLRNVATGRRVNNAADNPAVYALTQQMASQSAGYFAMSESLDLGVATVAVGRGAAERVVSTLSEIRSQVIAAGAPGADAGKIQTHINSLTEQVGSLISSASFGGVNLLQGPPEGSGDLEFLTALGVDADGQFHDLRVTVDNQNLQPGGLSALASINVTTAEGRESALAAIDGALETATSAASALGSAQRHLDSQSDVLSEFATSLESGVGHMVDTDLEEESVRQAAASVQQALAREMTAIANAHSENVLALFKKIQA